MESSSLTSLPASKDRDSFPRGSGFLFHWRLRPGCPGTSYIASTGSRRQPGGQNVPGGIDVPVMQGAAAGTHPVPCPEAQRGEQVPARRAGLGGWVPAVHYSHRTTAAFGLVFKHGPELCPPTARDRARQRTVHDHSAQVQVFYGDHVKPLNQTGAGLVQEIPARVSYSRIRLGYPDSCFGAVAGALLTTGEPALIPLEPPLVPFPVLRMTDLLARGQDGEIGQANVDPSASACSGQRPGMGHLRMASVGRPHAFRMAHSTVRMRKARSTGFLRSMEAGGT